RLHTRAPAHHGVLLERAGFRSAHPDHVGSRGKIRVARAVGDHLDRPGRTMKGQRRREVGMKVAAIGLAAALAAAGVGTPRAAAAQDAPRGVELAAAGPRFLAVAAGAAVDAGARGSDASDAAVFRRPITVDWRGGPPGGALSEIAPQAGLRLTYTPARVRPPAPLT